MHLCHFNPALLLKNPHIQTLYPALMPKSPLQKYEIETFILEDGDFIESFWAKKPDKYTKGIVTLFHGLAGSYRSHYIRRIVLMLIQEGFSVVVMHFRGCGTRPNRLPRSYHSGDTADAFAWLQHLKKHYLNTPLYAVGYSLGGNMLLKLLGELQHTAPLQKAVAVSAPMQLDICANRMNQGFSKLYQHHLLTHLKRDLIAKYRQFDMQKLLNLTTLEVQKINTFWEFDDRYTASIHGFKNAAEYYRISSARQYLNSIHKETLIIHALDDPFMTREVLPKQSDLPSCVTLHLQQNGGHVGFIGGTVFQPHYWLEETICRFFIN